MQDNLCHFEALFLFVDTQKHLLGPKAKVSSLDYVEAPQFIHCAREIIIILIFPLGGQISS